MTNALINGQHLAKSFIDLFRANGTSTAKPISNISTKPIILTPIPDEIKIRLPELFSPATVDNKYQQIFEGNLTYYNNDHSKADLALSGYLARKGLSQAEADQVIRGSRLYRAKWDQNHGPTTYGQLTLTKAFTDVQVPALPNTQPKNVKAPPLFASPAAYRPTYFPNGMSPRQFVGPKICEGIRLFPANALSTLVALGAMGKTTLLISIASHVAAGKSWNGDPLRQQKAVMFFCEEDQNEVNRKFSAITSSWSQEERQAAEENLLLIPLVGVDARLTTIDKGHHGGSGVTEQIIGLLNQFEVKDGLVILDHMQGFTAGDLNLSETATAISREANKIVRCTGGAVVLAAHISKNNIKATEFEQGFAVGSLAFENATRQMSGLIPMSEEQAKKYGLEGLKRDYVWLSIAKNSYGRTTDGVWLKKVLSPEYHTITLEPALLSIPIPAAKLSENQKIAKRIADYVAKHPNSTKNTLDRISGVNGEFKASKVKVRDCLKVMLETGEIEIHIVTAKERLEHSIPKQVKDVLRVNTVKTTSKSASYSDQE
jgi:hypothetical protein